MSTSLYVFAWLGLELGLGFGFGFGLGIGLGSGLGIGLGLGLGLGLGPEGDRVGQVLSRTRLPRRPELSLVRGGVRVRVRVG